MLIKLDMVIEVSASDVDKMIKHLVSAVSDSTSYVYDSDEDEGEWLGEHRVQGYTFTTFKEV